MAESSICRQLLPVYDGESLSAAQIFSSLPARQKSPDQHESGATKITLAANSVNSLPILFPLLITTPYVFQASLVVFLYRSCIL